MLFSAIFIQHTFQRHRFKNIKIKKKFVKIFATTSPYSKREKKLDIEQSNVKQRLNVKHRIQVREYRASKFD